MLEEIRPEEIEIIRRIGPKIRSRYALGDQGSRPSKRKQHVSVKFLSHKSKMRILLRRRLLRGKGILISEDMANDMAMRGFLTVEF